MTEPLQPLTEAAKGETTLRGIGLTDPVSMRDTVFQRFASEVAPWVDLEYRQEVNPHHLLEALRGEEQPDFLIVTNPARLESDGLIQPFPQPNEDAYPDDWADRESRWLPVYVQPTVVVYNRYHAPSPPSSWADLASARWQGKLVLDAPWHMLVAGSAMAEVRSVIGADWETWIDDLSASKPMIVGDNERSVLEVTVGNMQVGLAPWNVARRVRPTSPTSHVFLDPTPCVPGFAAFASGSTNPNLGRLFLAWLGSPSGQAAYAATGRIPAIPDLDVPTALSQIIPADIQAIFGSVDWLTNPGPYVDRYLQAFPAAEPLPEGKLR